MKKFNSDKFCKDLVNLRGNETQQSFSGKLNINRSTLSLLESGKQTPSMDIFNRVCTLGGFKPEDYFEESEENSLIFLMGTLKEEDRDRISDMMNRIEIKEKYEILARRCKNGFN